MSRRERFTPYEKEQACLDYINGNRSRSEICNCLHISTRTIQDWAAIYKKYGILGFTKKTKNSSYSKEFKMELVEKCISGEASSIDLGHQYDSDGEEGLVDKRGHHKLDDEVDELERLRRENVRLKRQLEEKDLAVELLKKVKEFGRM